MSYQLPIKILWTSYQHPINFLSQSQQHPINILSMSYQFPSISYDRNCNSSPREWGTFLGRWTGRVLEHLRKGRFALRKTRWIVAGTWLGLSLISAILFQLLIKDWDEGRGPQEHWPNYSPENGSSLSSEKDKLFTPNWALQTLEDYDVSDPTTAPCIGKNSEIPAR